MPACRVPVIPSDCPATVLLPAAKPPLLFSQEILFMSKRRRNRRAKIRREIVTPDGYITVPPGSPKILIHTRQGRCVGIYCDQPAKVLIVETQDDPRCAVHPSHLAVLSMISPQTSVKLVGGYGTSVDHVLSMGLDDPDMDDDLRHVLDAHEIVLEDDWPDVW
jgi:hypothetical protein